jgi:hypothetical protein
MIVKSLVTAAIELGEKKLIVRAISPATTMFSADYRKVIFTSLTTICKVDDKVFNENHAPCPYNSLEYYGLTYLDDVCHERDLWSIGIIIFEVLVGSNFLKFRTTYKWVSCLWDSVRPYLDHQLQALLDWLLYQKVEIDLKCFVTNAFRANPNLVVENKRRVRAARTDDLKLGQLWDRVQDGQ